MRMRVGVKALAVSAAVFGALASTASTATASTAITAGTATTFVCGEPTALPNDPGSTAKNCYYINPDGTSGAVAAVDFHSANPAAWTACYINVSLYRVNTDGSETYVNGATGQNDCLPQAQSSTAAGSIGPNTTLSSGTYRVKLGMAGNYNGAVVYGFVGSPVTIYV